VSGGIGIDEPGDGILQIKGDSGNIADVDDQGFLNFYDDIYERDAVVLESLDRQR